MPYNTAREESNLFLPVVIEKDEMYLSILEKKFKQYQQYLDDELPIWRVLSQRALDNNWDIEFIRQSTKEICDNLLNSISLYYEGNTVCATNTVEKIISRICEHDINDFFISTIDRSYATRETIPFDFLHKDFDRIQNLQNTPLSFFRARTDPVEQYKDMGHVPLNMREKVGTQRFSIPGIPCLYLGTSSLNVWKELRCPAFHNFNVSAIQLTERGKNRKILNLISGLSLLAGLQYELSSNVGLSNFNREKLRNLIEILYLSWPLVCATSFRVKNETRAFHSEYIISHLIMCCLKKLHIDGIAYISKQTIPLPECYALPQMVNIAFPVFESQDNSNNGKIYDSFKFSNPVNFEAYLCLERNQSHPIKNFSYYSKVYGSRACAPLSHVVWANQVMDYRGVQFNAFDNYLCQFDVYSFIET